VSPFYHYKHQIEVIKAVEILKNSDAFDVRLNLIGGGDSSGASMIKNYVIEQNLQEFVAIEGSINDVDLLWAYRNADIFIFASSCETFGITLLEAMGARLPIACSNRSGLPDILKDGGIYFDPEDPNSISRALKDLICDIGLREILGERAYRYSLDYTWERCASQTFSFIKNL